MESEDMKKFKKIENILSQKFEYSPNYHKISIAPMLDITNTHFRFLVRLLSQKVALYTEMIHENTILHYKTGYEDLLFFNKIEHPIVCQLGGNNIERLKKCALICESLNYDEININIGCPSPKVQEGAFGACLMKNPELVAELTKEMSLVVKIPITVKCRLGIDEFDNYEFVKDFIEIVSKKGSVKHFIIHARKAFLKGLNPAENRNVPPLKYEWVLKLKNDFPDLEFSINGGFKEINKIEEILIEENKLKGCMVGRLSYENPWILSDFDRVFYNSKNPGYSRREILEIWAEYGDYCIAKNKLIKPPTLVKPIINLFNGDKFNSKYRQYLSDPINFKKTDYFSEFIYNCIDLMDKINKEALDLKPKNNL